MVVEPSLIFYLVLFLSCIIGINSSLEALDTYFKIYTLSFLNILFCCIIGISSSLLALGTILRYIPYHLSLIYSKYYCFTCCSSSSFLPLILLFSYSFILLFFYSFILLFSYSFIFSLFHLILFASK
jgi:hypothetical protein